MTNEIQPTLTNGNGNLCYQSTERSLYVSSKARLKLVSRLTLVAVAITAVPAWAQSAFEALPPVNTLAMSTGTNNFTLPSSSSSAIIPERAPAVAPTESITLPQPVPARASSNAKKWWVISGIAMTAASLADFGTSMGHIEANPALQTSTGQFSAARGLSLKLGIAGATMLFQALITRHHKELYGPCAVINAVGAGAFGAAAIHNSNTPR
jgi:hypothetical protein